MPRIRTIKPDAFRSETLSSVSLSAERTFFGLLTEADDRGRLKDRPAVLNGALWSLRPEHGVRDMHNDLDELAGVGVLCRYEVESTPYIHLPTFREHQRINRPTESKLPGCPTCPQRRGGTVPDEEYDILIAGPSLSAVEHHATVTPLPGHERRG